ncbi:MAG: hypothetical protein OQL09_02445 [Gammaproteobacteria bacterium]|nr:hypothetical protein [Gammaproteobacteria bacterium]
MNMKSIHEITKQQGIAAGKPGKIELVRTLQRGERNFDCFAKAYDAIAIRQVVCGGKTVSCSRSGAVKTVEHRGAHRRIDPSYFYQEA